MLRTVDVDLVLLHELSELSEPLSSVDLLHFDGRTRDGRRMEGSEEAIEGPGDYICCSSCVGAQKKALSKHESVFEVSAAELPRGLHLRFTADLARLPKDPVPLLTCVCQARQTNNICDRRIPSFTSTAMRVSDHIRRHAIGL